MSNLCDTQRDSAETVFLLRCWHTPDGSPRFLLETVGEDQKRRLFQQLPEMTAHLQTVLTPKPKSG